jgi:hypothetical protein
MKKSDLSLILIFVIMFSLVGIIAEDNTNFSLEYPANSTNISTISINPSNISTPNTSVSIISIIPRNFKIGDAQINIRVQNNDNTTKTNLIAIISGKGFSTYDVVPIDSLAPGERDYIILTCSLREAGNITLTIRIDDNIFKEEISVIDPVIVEQQIQEEQNKQILVNLSLEFLNLKQNYSTFENEYYYKKDNNYDVSKVNLDQLKSYIRTIDSNLLNEDIKNTRANIKLANDEYIYQKDKLDSSTTISLLTRLKDNAVLFSAIAGAILTFFALSELLRRKGENIVGKIHESKSKNNSKKKKR